MDEQKQLSDRAKKLVLMGADAIFLPLALWAAVVVRYGNLYQDVTAFWWLFPGVTVFGVLSFYKFDLYRAIIRYLGPASMLPVVKGVTVAAIGVSLLAYLTGAVSFPRSSPVIFWFIGILFVAGSRLAIRAWFYGLPNRYLTRDRVAIYGAGETGARLAAALLNDSNYVPIAFIDDDRSMRKNTIHGIRVYDTAHIDRLVEESDIREIFLAIPSATSAQRKVILDRLAELPVHVRTVPGFSELITGEAQVSEIEEVEIGDLLGRDVVPPDNELLAHSIAGKSVLVTGAGGTIGSELCRKIMGQRPRRLVLFDNSEFALYTLEKELRDALADETELVCLLGSVLNYGHLSMVMDSFAIQTVYHAAAYKHVPMVERNVIEGVRNNVVGTWNSVRAAADSQVDEFVLISTDKAVKPTNVMGATKRLAELVVQAFAAEMTAANPTRFCMVRFGNVLRSSGSVVPIFEQQIMAGGPLQVTHRDAMRYFMTASEAADLVIQAGAMSLGGELYVLDMGEPVRIDDLARKMIHLHGKEVVIDREPHDDAEVRIEYVGLRPGEKLVEELIIGANVAGTRHPKIMKAQEEFLPLTTITGICQQLEVACERADYLEVKRTLEQYVFGYRMIDEAVDPLLAIARRKQGASNVTPFKAE